MITGVINLLKPPGMTSHDAVSFIRRTYGQKQVGHAGTLDPAAAGVLPIFLGKATRLVEYLTDDDKQYRAELRFGQETDSGDYTGSVTRTSDSIPSPEVVCHVLNSFLGQSQQIPPMYSAIKVGGRKLYELARQGIVLERKARSITIHSISLLQMKDQNALFDVSCTKGTYIRSLCSDIGVRCGSAATMTFLLRTGVGCFSLQNAVSLEEIAHAPEQVVLPADSALIRMPSITLSHADTTKFLTGQKTYLHEAAMQPKFKVYSSDNTFIGIGGTCGELLVPQKVLPPEVSM
ncbi:MAG: tRNA pseudouridine synthase [Anaerosporomusa subterranea]|nr:tRNA pseudouridine synthase [Anaerosporomusa subterranea]